jgi:membrane-associated phospholipid phosphatase
MSTFFNSSSCTRKAFRIMAPSFTPRRVFGAQLLRVACIAVVAMSSSAALHAADDLQVQHAPHARINPVLHWNNVAAEAYKPTQGFVPLAQTRTFSIMHASIHDALNAIERRYASYTPGLTPAPRASADAAVAAAARQVLVQLIPDQAALIEGAYVQALATVREGPAKKAGITTGQAAALATLTRRQADGSDQATQPVYVPRPGAGEYQFTAPFDFANLPGWGRVQPFGIVMDEHKLDGPLALSSREYARDFAGVKEIGRVDSRTRTAEQTEIAKFWYEDSPLAWNRIANAVAGKRRLDAWEAARAFTLLNFAMADGFIAGFDAKYHFRTWRPITAIHAAAADGNALTEADPSWQPLLLTPPVPDYPSTHTVLGWAAAEVLTDLFGHRVRYETTSLTLPGVTRSYRSFAQAAEENGLSRIYAGIHFKHSVRDGRHQGRSIGQAVAEMLPPVR